MSDITLYPWRATVEDSHGESYGFTVLAEDPIAAVENAGHGIPVEVLMIEAEGNGFVDDGAAHCPLCALEAPGRCGWHEQPAARAVAA